MDGAGFYKQYDLEITMNLELRGESFVSDCS